jgi:hypothetical protein
MVWAAIQTSPHASPEMDQSLMESAQVIEIKEKEQVAESDRHEPGAIHQPGTVVVAFQPPGA